MEVFQESQDDSSGAAPSVKSEDGSPGPEGNRASPPPNCAICLGRCRNKSFTDSCLHQFCFKCLVTWSKVKSECPLCKQNFKSIIHNVRSNQQYDQYQVEQRRVEEDRIDIDDLMTATRRFRYRTTLTFPRGRETIALQQLLMHYPLSAMVGDLPAVAPAPLPSLRRRRSPSSFRRTVYRHNLWARPLPDFTGRFRDCTPEFYRYNHSQMHRLVPWLNRELHYLLLENAGHIAYVLARILELLPQYHIMSPEFREDMYRFFGSRTDHFLHELQCFASTPYDMTGYDRNVQYTTGDSRISNAIYENVIASSDTESGDSDIVLVSTPPSPSARFADALRMTPSVNLEAGAGAGAGPSLRRPPDPVYPRSNIAPHQSGVIPIETISHSDTDDDEVMVTGYIKPPQSRTPEIVDLIASDSDVVVQEDPPERPRGSLVQLTLSRPRPTRPARSTSPSDSDDASHTPPHAPPRRRRRPRHSSVSSQERDSDPDSSSSESERTPSPLRPISSLDSSVDIETLRPTFRSAGRSHRSKRTDHAKDSDRDSSEAASSSSSMATPSPMKTPSPLRPVPESPMSPSPSPVLVHGPSQTSPSPSPDERSSPRVRRVKDKRSKRKSRNGKGVKSSKRDISVDAFRDKRPSSRPDKRTNRQENPGPSGTANHPRRNYSREDSEANGICNLKSINYEETPGPSGVSSSRRKQTEQNHSPGGSADRSKCKYSRDDPDPGGVGSQKVIKDDETPGPSGVCAPIRKYTDAGPSRSTDYPKRKYSREDLIPDGVYNLKRKNYEENPGPSGISNSKKKHTDEYPGPSSAPDHPKRKNSREEPLPNGFSNIKRKNSEENPGPSSSASSKRKHEEGRARRNSRESKRLKSVVKRASGPEKARTKLYWSSSDSEDDIPLNLTIQKPA